MKILTLKLFQTFMSFFLLLNTKEDIFKNDWNFGTIDFHSIFFSTMEVNGAKQLFQTFFKISSFVFSRRNKLVQVYNNLRVSR